MDIITSSSNQFVKLTRSLSDKKVRLDTGLFVIEGGVLIKDLPSSVEVEFILAVPEREQEVQKLVDTARAQVYYISDSLMKSLSDTVTPFGIIAVAKKPLTEFCLPVGNAILLDGVSDPGNLGTILRTAAACGFNTVYLLNCADCYSPKTVRASMGGIFKVKTVEVTDEQALSLVSATNSAALDMLGEDLTLNGITSPVLLVAGSEAHGVSAPLIEASKTVLSLPMQGGIESLNVAVASAVAMYYTIRRSK